MGIGKAVYGTAVLLDPTSDTADAAHPAKGRTAHDAAGDTVTGTSGRQESGDLLGDITPTPPDGTARNGKPYAIPTAGPYGTERIRFGMPTADTRYRPSAYGETAGRYRAPNPLPYSRKPDGGGDCAKPGTRPPIEDPAGAGIPEPASGAEPTGMETTCGTADGPSAGIAPVKPDTR